jgi:hypothetical protein
VFSLDICSFDSFTIQLVRIKNFYLLLLLKVQHTLKIKPIVIVIIVIVAVV